mmetsp:Transcript_2749/g.4735  ORF Transcript_2749/g.4735 Transcript_2749/m.4735 type:complete len:297 (-) Transcript_2749:29-919(-)
MFACINQADGISPATAGRLDTGSGDANNTMEAIIAESEKLRRRCKSMRAILLETESKRNEEKQRYELEITKLTQELESGYSDIRAQHYIEMRQMKDFKTAEMETIIKERDAAMNELSMQGPLIIAMSHKITALEHEIVDGTQPAQIRDASPSNVDIMEAEVEILKNQLEFKTKELDHVKNEISIVVTERHNAVEEAQYYKEENAKLEVDIQFLKSNLQAAEKSFAGSERKTMKKQKLLQELAVSRSQISELKLTIEELVRAKRSVENAVHDVIVDNERLSKAVDDLTNSINNERLI